MPPTKDIQRQIAVTVVIAVEEASLLMPVQRVVGGVEVECNLRRRLVVGIEKQIDEQPLHGVSIGGDLVVAGRLGGAAFQPVQRTLAGQGRAVGAAGSE